MVDTQVSVIWFLECIHQKCEPSDRGLQPADFPDSRTL